MIGPLYKKLCVPKNLSLAFTRLQTAQNLEYKSLYRRSFNAYTLAQDENIDAPDADPLGQLSGALF
jgi:hypothetical protein